mmetsp:Transcript_110527/g.356763  ORF Transcript_110527/g.356763 Transcript_110527/m.356763 type:complete len:724 (-) Transcript_110527:210-2381(-)
MAEALQAAGGADVGSHEAEDVDGFELRLRGALGPGNPGLPGRLQLLGGAPEHALARCIVPYADLAGQATVLPKCLLVVDAEAAAFRGTALAQALHGGHRFLEGLLQAVLHPGHLVGVSLLLLLLCRLFDLLQRRVPSQLALPDCGLPALLLPAVLLEAALLLLALPRLLQRLRLPQRRRQVRGLAGHCAPGHGPVLAVDLDLGGHPAGLRACASQQPVVQPVLHERDLFHQCARGEPFVLLQRVRVAPNSHDDAALLLATNDPPDLLEAPVVAARGDDLAQLVEAFAQEVHLVALALRVELVLLAWKALRCVVFAQRSVDAVRQLLPGGRQTRLQLRGWRVQRRQLARHGRSLPLDVRLGRAVVERVQVLREARPPHLLLQARLPGEVHGHPRGRLGHGGLVGAAMQWFPVHELGAAVIGKEEPDPVFVALLARLLDVFADGPVPLVAPAVGPTDLITHVWASVLEAGVVTLVPPAVQQQLEALLAPAADLHLALVAALLPIPAHLLLLEVRPGAGDPVARPRQRVPSVWQQRRRGLLIRTCYCRCFLLVCWRWRRRYLHRRGRLRRRLSCRGRRLGRRLRGLLGGRAAVLVEDEAATRTQGQGLCLCAGVLRFCAHVAAAAALLASAAHIALGVHVDVGHVQVELEGSYLQPRAQRAPLGWAAREPEEGNCPNLQGGGLRQAVQQRLRVQEVLEIPGLGASQAGWACFYAVGGHGRLLQAGP